MVVIVSDGVVLAGMLRERKFSNRAVNMCMYEFSSREYVIGYHLVF